MSYYTFSFRVKSVMPLLPIFSTLFLWAYNNWELLSFSNSFLLKNKTKHQFLVLTKPFCSKDLRMESVFLWNVTISVNVSGYSELHAIVIWTEEVNVFSFREHFIVDTYGFGTWGFAINKCLLKNESLFKEQSNFKWLKYFLYEKGKIMSYP